MKLGKWGIGTDNWMYFGLVGNVFWIWRLGITLKWYGPKGDSGGRTRPGLSVLRMYPFVFVWSQP